jgi:hypothetical protein
LVADEGSQGPRNDDDGKACPKKERQDRIAGNFAMCVGASKKKGEEETELDGKKG